MYGNSVGNAKGVVLFEAIGWTCTEMFVKRTRPKYISSSRKRPTQCSTLLNFLNCMTDIYNRCVVNHVIVRAAAFEDRRVTDRGAFHNTYKGAVN